MTTAESGTHVAHRVLVVDDDTKRRRQVAQVIGRVLGSADAVSSLASADELAGYDLAIANWIALPPDTRTILENQSRQRNGPKVLFLWQGSDRRQLESLFVSKSLTNLLAFAEDDGPDIDELIVTAQKILKRDIFGIEKYFVWGVPTRKFELRRSTQKDELLAEVQSYVETLGIQRRLASLFETATDEFATNAIYNSPVDSQGKHRFGHVSRSIEVVLEPAEHIDIRFCCDGRRLGVSVIDPFGSLATDTVLDYLSKCFRKEDDQVDSKEGGAGLGFYQILDALSHFVINLCPGKSTEMIGLIDISGTYKDFVVKGKSFNIFVE